MSDPRPSARAHPFEARPLTDPVPPGAARAFAQELRSTGRLPSRFGTSGAVVAIVVVVVVVLFGSVFVTMLTTAVSGFMAFVQGDGWIGLVFTLFPLVVVGIIVAVALTFLFQGTRTRDERMYRLDGFARANGMTYVPQFDNPGLPGMIFSLGGSRQSTDLVRGERPRFVEFANYRYTTGSGKNRQTHVWGYIAVKLDTPLPHIVLDATGNNALFGSNLPLVFDKDQRLSLEGDFDRHFALYCPAGYERDALYLFTPDIMARFIDNAAALDVEIVDDWLFLYSKREFSTLDPATWAWLFSVVGALLDKFAQWARWRDDRLAAEAAMIPDASPPAGFSPQVAATGAGAAGGAAASSIPFSPPLDALRPPPGVALQGRRLQRGVPWVTFVVAGVFVLFWLLTQTGVLGLFFR